MKSAAFLHIDSIDCRLVEKCSSYGQCLEKLSGWCQQQDWSLKVQLLSALKKKLFASFGIKIKKHVFMPKVA